MRVLAPTPGTRPLGVRVNRPSNPHHDEQGANYYCDEGPSHHCLRVCGGHAQRRVLRQVEHWHRSPGQEIIASQMNTGRAPLTVEVVSGNRIHIAKIAASGAPEGRDLSRRLLTMICEPPCPKCSVGESAKTGRLGIAQTSQTRPDRGDRLRMNCSRRAERVGTVRSPRLRACGPNGSCFSDGRLSGSRAAAPSKIGRASCRERV